MDRDNKKEIARALRATIGSSVLDELSRIAPIPEQGTVAGQAVASVVMKRLGLGLNAPINDVDVFLSVASSDRAKQMEKDAMDGYKKKLRNRAKIS